MTAASLTLRSLALTLAALTAFASNSLLCRLALRSLPGSMAAIDPATFTFLRLSAGALTLWLLVLLRNRSRPAPGEMRPWKGDWLSSLALFAYAAPFSFAYLHLTAGTGALILFGSVQATMIGWGLYQGTRPGLLEWAGLGLALSGLALLVAPGVSAPAPLAALLMGISGISWGAYSLRGRGSTDPIAATAGNFIFSLAFAAPLMALAYTHRTITGQGIALAIASGALSSGIGYAVWYTALKYLTAVRAAVVQLLVPVLTALAGILFLGERFSLRLVVSGLIILVGISLVVLRPAPK